MALPRDEPALVLADALSALGEVPVDVVAASALASYRLRVIDVTGGDLVADCADERPQTGAELLIRTSSDRRAAYDIDCIVCHARGRRVKLAIRSVARVPGRRHGKRASIHELFLIYGDIEADGDVIDVSQDGMRFICAFPMQVGGEVRGMLNIDGRVFPIAAEVRHTTKRSHSYEIGVAFRHLRDEERDLFTKLTVDDETGRRDTDASTAPQPAVQDIRDRLRRWAA
jgi:hypothetical protein